MSNCSYGEKFSSGLSLSSLLHSHLLLLNLENFELVFQVGNVL